MSGAGVAPWRKGEVVDDAVDLVGNETGCEDRFDFPEGRHHQFTGPADLFDIGRGLQPDVVALLIDLLERFGGR